MNQTTNGESSNTNNAPIYSSIQRENPIANLSTLINSVLLSSIQITNLQLLKLSVGFLGSLILLLHIVPVSVLLIVLLILFIIFTIVYVIVYGYRFSAVNKPINPSKLQTFRHERNNNNNSNNNDNISR